MTLSSWAEGVEALDQAIFLRERGCEMAQGYPFSPPVDPATLVELLANDDRIARPIATRRRRRAC